MSGAWLYNQYRNAMADEGIALEESWEDLSNAEQNAWTHVAEDLVSKYNIPDEG